MTNTRRGGRDERAGGTEEMEPVLTLWPLRLLVPTVQKSGTKQVFSERSRHDCQMCLWVMEGGVVGEGRTDLDREVC